MNKISEIANNGPRKPAMVFAVSGSKASAFDSANSKMCVVLANASDGLKSIAHPPRVHNAVMTPKAVTDDFISSFSSSISSTTVVVEVVVVVVVDDDVFVAAAALFVLLLFLFSPVRSPSSKIDTVVDSLPFKTPRHPIPRLPFENAKAGRVVRDDVDVFIALFSAVALAGVGVLVAQILIRLFFFFLFCVFRLTVVSLYYKDSKHKGGHKSLLSKDKNEKNEKKEVIGGLLICC